MKKLKLDLDRLTLESFQVDDLRNAPRGTVAGADSTKTDGCGNSYPLYCPPRITDGCA